MSYSQPRVAAALRGTGVVLAAMLVVVALMISTQVVVTSHFRQTAAFYLYSTLALALVYHVLGGVIGAALSHDSRPVTTALILAGTALMISSVHHTWPTVAPWYSVAMLIIAPAGLTLGIRWHAHRG